jgi:uncharacterized coiled-coil protein SlyX
LTFDTVVAPQFCFELQSHESHDDQPAGKPDFPIWYGCQSGPDSRFTPARTSQVTAESPEKADFLLKSSARIANVHHPVASILIELHCQIHFSMSTIELVFNDNSWPVPWKSIFELLNHHRELLDVGSYSVRSSVPLDDFQVFLDSLTSQQKPTVTEQNAVSLSLLAKEFFLADLESECGLFPVSADQFSTLSARVADLERQLASFSKSTRKLDARIECQEEGLENIRFDVRKLKKSLRKSERPRVPPPSDQPTPKPVKALRQCDIPIRSLDGIIACLTEQCRGNVHEKGIVTITSKSVDGFDPSQVVQNVADLKGGSSFCSMDSSDQWVCWDFRERRVRLTYYTLTAGRLKSWVIEGSLDGENWAEMDRQTHNDDFKRGGNASFAVSKSMDCRFIRLTQIGKNHVNESCRRVTMDRYILRLGAIEFFGTLFEDPDGPRTFRDDFIRS